MLYLYGDHGAIHNVGGLFLDSERYQECVDGFIVVAVPEGDSFTEEIRHFATCLLDNRVPLTNGVDARKTLEVCLAAYLSSETGQIVHLPLESK